MARSGKTTELPDRGSTLLLGALCIQANRTQPRAKLAGLIWPEADESTGRANLRHALWRLKEAVGEQFIKTSRETIRIQSSPDLWIM